MTRKLIRSPFAAALEALLDRTKLFTRREWASLLRIKEAAISQWLSEETIPRAGNLNMIYITVDRASDADKAPLAIFKHVADLPALTASPKNGKRMLPTVWAYMKRPLFDELSNRLARLSPEDQEMLLTERFLPQGERSPNHQPLIVEKQKTLVGNEVPTPSAGSKSGLEVSLPPLTPIRLQEGVSLSFPERRLLTPELPTDHVYLTPTFRLLPEGELGNPMGPNILWEQIANETNRCVVFGSAGVGKTLFLRHLFYALRERTSAVPRAWSQGTPAFVQLHKLPAVETIDDLWNAFRKTIESPHRPLVLLLDGFDEVLMERREGLLRAVAGLQESRSDTVFIMTSRPTRGLSALLHMKRYAMQPPADSRLLCLAYANASLVATDGGGWDDALLQISRLRERPDVFRAIASPLLLSVATELFAKGIFANRRETDVLDSCLTFLYERWDKQKKVVRSRSRWTSTSPSKLYQWLGGLCYHSLMHQIPIFTCDHIGKWYPDSQIGTPREVDLQAIAEATGVLESTSESSWRIVHQTIREYLAAKYVVESSRNATDYLRESIQSSWVASVLGFACSMTHDATPLLRLVLNAQQIQEPMKMKVMAGMLSQNLDADREVLARCYGNLVSWLESEFKGWKVVVSEEQESFPAPKWRLTARSKEAGKDMSVLGKEVVDSIKAVHRTRLSPSGKALSEMLGRSSIEVVQTLGESLRYDGCMEGRSFSQGENSVFAAEVSEA